MLLDVLPRAPDMPALHALLAVAPSGQSVDRRHDIAGESDVVRVGSQRTVVSQCGRLLYDTPPIA
jgi:hypothetical protein